MIDQEPLPGKLVAVEGVDGSGKSTQIHLLQQWLTGLGQRVFFSEWNSSPLARQVTKKGKKRQLLSPTTFSLTHAVDFTDRYERQILPMLKAGYLVLCDRYIFTSFARDTVRGCDPTWVRTLYSFARIPDLTFYFHAPQEIAAQRILAGRPQLKYFEAGMDLGLSTDIVESFRIYQGRVMEQYLSMAKEYGFTVMDATRPILEQQLRVREVAARTLDLPRAH